MRLFRPNPEAPNPPAETCVVLDRVIHPNAPEPTLLEYAFGHDFFPWADKHTPEESLTAIKRFAGRFIPALRRPSEESNSTPSDIA